MGSAFKRIAVLAALVLGAMLPLAAPAAASDPDQWTRYTDGNGFEVLSWYQCSDGIPNVAVVFLFQDVKDHNGWGPSRKFCLNAGDRGNSYDSFCEDVPGQRWEALPGMCGTPFDDSFNDRHVLCPRRPDVWLGVRQALPERGLPRTLHDHRRRHGQGLLERWQAGPVLERHHLVDADTPVGFAGLCLHRVGPVRFLGYWELVVVAVLSIIGRVPLTLAAGYRAVTDEESRLVDMAKFLGGVAIPLVLVIVFASGGPRPVR